MKIFLSNKNQQNKIMKAKFNNYKIKSMKIKNYNNKLLNYKNLYKIKKIFYNKTKKICNKNNKKKKELN